MCPPRDRRPGIISEPAAFVLRIAALQEAVSGWCSVAEQGRHLSGAAGVRFEARCSWCGPFRLGPSGLGLHLGSGSDALIEYTCPRCARLNVRPLRSGDVAALALAGVHSVGGVAPFELLEERSGPPIGWDDVLDFHQGLWREDWRWSELEGASAGPLADRERDAA
jgi:hypothetical protein